MDNKYQQKNNNTENFIITCLITCFYSLSYRYPFQINSSTTSPTYTDTPLILQISKYIIFISTIYIFLIISLSKDNLKNKFTLKKTDIIISTLIFYTITTGIILSIATNETLYIENVLFLSFATIFILLNEKIRLDKFTKIFSWFIYISTIFNFIQIILFYFFGRLPALAYKSSLSVRFGSIWDDPNAYSIFLSFIIPFLFFKKNKSILTWIMIYSNILFLILTQSLTGIASFIGAICLVRIISATLPWDKKAAKFLRGPFNIFLIIFAATTIFSTTIFYIYNINIFKILIEIWTLKQGSILDHFLSFDILLDSGHMSLLGLSPSNATSESGYINRIINFGIPIFLLSLIAVLFAYLKLIILFRKLWHQKGAETLYSLLFFLPTTAFSTINLPIDHVFPINFIIIIFLCLIWQSQKIIKE